MREARTDLCLKFKALQMKTLFVEGKAACNLRSSSLFEMMIFLMLLFVLLMNTNTLALRTDLG